MRKNEDQEREDERKRKAEETVHVDGLSSRRRRVIGGHSGEERMKRRAEWKYERPGRSRKGDVGLFCFIKAGQAGMREAVLKHLVESKGTFCLRPILRSRSRIFAGKTSDSRSRRE